MREHGGAIVGLILLMVFIVIGLGVCIAAVDNDETKRASFLPSLVLAHSPTPEDNRPCEGENACQGRQKKGCAEASAPCSDDDKVTIIICPQPDSCRFEGEPS